MIMSQSTCACNGAFTLSTHDNNNDVSLVRSGLIVLLLLLCYTLRIHCESKKIVPLLFLL